MRIVRIILAVLILAGMAAAPAIAGGLALGATGAAHCEMASALELVSAADDCGDCSKDKSCPGLGCAAICSQVMGAPAVVPVMSQLFASACSFSFPPTDSHVSWLDSVQPPPPRA